MSQASAQSTSGVTGNTVGAAISGKSDNWPLVALIAVIVLAFFYFKK